MSLSLFLALQAALSTQRLLCTETPANPQYVRTVTISTEKLSDLNLSYLVAEDSKSYPGGPHQVENFTLRMHDIDGTIALSDYLEPGSFRLDLYPGLNSGPEEQKYLGRLSLHVGSVMEEYVKNLVCELAPPAEATVIEIKGEAGKCTPEMIHVKARESRKFRLTGEAMYLFAAPDLQIELMNMPHESVEQIFKFEKKGSFPFTCGKHGAPQQTHGSIMVM